MCLTCTCTIPSSIYIYSYSHILLNFIFIKLIWYTFFFNIYDRTSELYCVSLFMETDLHKHVACFRIHLLIVMLKYCNLYTV